MEFKEKVKRRIKGKIRNKMELDKLYKDTARILGISPSIVREFVTSPHSETGPGMGLNIVTPRQLAKEIEEAVPDIRD